MIKHTPGPWTLHAHMEGADVRKGQHMICTMNVEGASDTANARLIAVAPELLKELRFALAYLPCSTRLTEHSRCHICAGARDAIAKAEGESNE